MGIENSRPYMGKSKGVCVTCYYSPCCSDSIKGKICIDYSEDVTMEAKHKKSKEVNND